MPDTSVQIFIPTFNRSGKLANAIQSVLGQTFSNLEVVVLDNHSEDDTPLIVSKLMAADSRITYIRRERNIGMIPGFNTIRTLVSSSYFSFLPDDDEYEPCFVETALECFGKDPRLGFVACNAPWLENGVVVKSQLDAWREGMYSPNTTVFKCLSGQYPLITNCLFKAELAGDFLFHEDLGGVADCILLTCLFSKYHAYVCKVTTGYWHNHGGNASALQGGNRILVLDTTIRESTHYKKFCRDNRIFMRGLLLLWLKRYLTVLMVADQSGFRRVCDESAMKTVFSPPAIASLWVLHQLRVIRLFLTGLSAYRQFHSSWIAWRES